MTAIKLSRYEKNGSHFFIFNFWHSPLGGNDVDDDSTSLIGWMSVYRFRKLRQRARSSSAIRSRTSHANGMISSFYKLLLRHFIVPFPMRAPPKICASQRNESITICKICPSELNAQKTSERTREPSRALLSCVKTSIADSRYFDRNIKRNIRRLILPVQHTV